MSEITRNQAIQIVEDIRTAISAGSVTNTMEAQVLEYCVVVLGRRIEEASQSGSIVNLPDVVAFLAGISSSTTLRELLSDITGKIPSEASSLNQLADKAFVTSLSTALQTAVNTINSAIGNGYVYAGIATLSVTPVSGKVFYLARQGGQYTNFGGLTVTEGINILKRNGSAWSQEQLMSMADIYKNPLIGYYECDTAGNTAAKTVTAAGYVLPTTGGSMKIKMANRNTAANATLNINSTGAKPLYYNGQRAGVGNTWGTNEVIEVFYDGTNYQAYNVAGSNGDGVFDISVYNLTNGQPTPYADLADALGTDGANIPLSLRKGGMSVKFIQGNALNSDNKYVQFRYMGTEVTGNPNPFLDETNWQGVETSLAPNSKNFVESGTILKTTEGRYFKNKGFGSHIKVVKNLLDESNFIYGKSLSSTSGLTINPNGIVSNKLYFENGQTYALQGIGIFGTPLCMVIGYFDSSDNFVGGERIENPTIPQSGVNRGNNTFTFNSSVYSNISYCRFLIQNGNTATYDKSLAQIELGSDYTEVVGYNEKVEFDFAVKDETDAKIIFDSKLAAKGIYVDYNHYVSLDESGNFIGYLTSQNIDSAFIYLDVNTTHLNTTNANVLRYVFFNNTILSTDSFIGSSTDGTIQGRGNAKVCVLTLRHTDNPDGVENMLVFQSNGIASDISNLNERTQAEKLSIVREVEIRENTRINSQGIVGDSSVVDLYIYPIIGGKEYTFSGTKIASNTSRFLGWFDSQGNCVQIEPYAGNASQVVSYVDQKVTAPSTASYIYMNVDHYYPWTYNIKSVADLTSQDISNNTVKKKLRLLSIGNSYSCDSLAYVPFILQNMGIDIDIQIGICMLSSSTPEMHVNNFINESAVYKLYLYNGGSAWTTTENVTIQSALKNYDWDIVTLQQSSAYAPADYDTYYQPYVNQLINLIYTVLRYPVKFGWILTPVRAISTAGERNYTDSEMANHYNLIAANCEKVMDDTLCSFLIPVGTAVQNARTIPTLKELGDYANDSLNTSGLGYLDYDGVHLQEGLPSQIAAYTCVIKILELLGFDENSVYGDTTRVVTLWEEGKSIPGPHGSCIGSTDNKCRMGQMCAVMANKRPYEVTNMNYIVNPT